MDETFKIFVDRLRNGEEEFICETVDPGLLDLSSEEVSFLSPVLIEGTAVLRQKELILQLSIETKATLLCAICNTPVEISLHIPDFIHTEALENIVSRVFEYQFLIREILLLELPMAIECCNGCCPERESLAKYLKKNTSSKEEQAYDHPFADL